MKICIYSLMFLLAVIFSENSAAQELDRLIPLTTPPAPEAGSLGGDSA